MHEKKIATNKARSNEHEKGPQSFFCAQEANDNASTLSALTETQSVSRGAEAQQHTNISGGTGSTAGSTLSNWHFCQCDFSHEGRRQKGQERCPI